MNYYYRTDNWLYQTLSHILMHITVHRHQTSRSLERRGTLAFCEYCECIKGGSSRVTEGIRITPAEQRLITRCVDVAVIALDE